jgi:hypothetical protein
MDEDDKQKTEEQLRADYRAIAERRVRLGLLLGEIGRVNGIVVTPEEVGAAIRAEAARYPGREAQMIEFYRKYPAATDALRGPIFEDKVVDYVLDAATVTDAEISVEALEQDPEVAKPAEAASGESAETASGESAETASGESAETASGESAEAASGESAEAASGEPAEVTSGEQRVEPETAVEAVAAEPAEAPITSEAGASDAGSLESGGSESAESNAAEDGTSAP